MFDLLSLLSDVTIQLLDLLGSLFQFITFIPISVTSIIFLRVGVCSVNGFSDDLLEVLQLFNELAVHVLHLLDQVLPVVILVEVNALDVHVVQLFLDSSQFFLVH